MRIDLPVVAGGGVSSPPVKRRVERGHVIGVAVADPVDVRVYGVPVRIRIHGDRGRRILAAGRCREEEQGQRVTDDAPPDQVRHRNSHMQAAARCAYSNTLRAFRRSRWAERRAPVRTKQDEPAQSALIKRRRDHKVLRFYTILSAMIKRVPSKQADEYWSLTPDTMNQICPAASEVQANRPIPTNYEKNIKKGD